MEEIKIFKDMKDFKTKVKTSLCWEDYFRIGRCLYKIFEYGGGSMFNMDYDYVYFYCKELDNMIYIKYDCPSYTYKNKVEILVKPYMFIDLETERKPYLWREDTI